MGDFNVDIDAIRKRLEEDRIKYQKEKLPDYVAYAKRKLQAGGQKTEGYFVLLLEDVIKQDQFASVVNRISRIILAERRLHG